MASVRRRRRMGGSGLGRAGYTANAVVFTASANIDRNAALTGSADTDKFIASAWVRTTDTVGEFFGYHFTGLDFRISAQKAQVFGTNGSFTTILDAVGDTTIIDGVWHHILVSRKNGTVLMYVDDAAENLTVTTNDNGDLNLDAGNFTIGEGLTSELADVQVWEDQFLDISSQANRRLFISADKIPIDPAIAAASLGSPIVACYGDTSSWHENKGTGGGFTVNNGPLTTSSNLPVKVGE